MIDKLTNEYVVEYSFMRYWDVGVSILIFVALAPFSTLLAIVGSIVYITKSASSKKDPFAKVDIRINEEEIKVKIDSKQKKISEKVPIFAIKSVVIKQNFLEKLLNYGMLELEVVGMTQCTFKYINKPNEVKSYIDKIIEKYKNSNDKTKSNECKL